MNDWEEDMLDTPRMLEAFRIAQKQMADTVYQQAAADYYQDSPNFTMAAVAQRERYYAPATSSPEFREKANAVLMVEPTTRRHLIRD